MPYLRRPRTNVRSRHIAGQIHTSRIYKNEIDARSSLTEKWLKYGGALFLNKGLNKCVTLCWTRDKAQIDHLYDTRSSKFQEYRRKDYLKYLARYALEYVGYADSFIDAIMLNW